MSEQEYKHIVRIAGHDIDGQETLLQGMTKIRGVGLRLSKTVIKMLELNPSNRLGYLTVDEISEIEKIVKSPVDAKIPTWYVNRQRDRRTGKMLHLLGSDLDFTQKNDIERLKRIKSWRGYRHSQGLKVRGQHTRTTGRGGAAVGVSRKKL